MQPSHVSVSSHLLQVTVNAVSHFINSSGTGNDAAHEYCTGLQAKSNPAYGIHLSMTELATSPESVNRLPWQLQAIAEAADFSDSREEATERSQHVMQFLSGMLQADMTVRVTSRELSAQQWLLEAGRSELWPCPEALQKALQRQ